MRLRLRSVLVLNARVRPARTAVRAFQCRCTGGAPEAGWVRMLQGLLSRRRGAVVVEILPALLSTGQRGLSMDLQRRYADTWRRAGVWSSRSGSVRNCRVMDASFSCGCGWRPVVAWHLREGENAEDSSQTVEAFFVCNRPSFKYGYIFLRTMWCKVFIGLPY